MQSAWNLTNVHRRKSSNYCSNQSSCNILIFMFVEPSVREMNWFNRVIYTLKSAQHSFCSLYLTAIQLVNGQWLAYQWSYTKRIYVEILIHFIPIDSPQKARYFVFWCQKNVTKCSSSNLRKTAEIWRHLLSSLWFVEFLTDENLVQSSWTNKNLHYSS